MLKSHNLFASKGKGKATYYIPGPDLKTEPITVSTEPIAVSIESNALSTEPNSHNTEPNSHNTEPSALSTEPGGLNTEANLQKDDNYLSRKYLKPMIDSFELRFQYPEMINHPDQAYKSNQNYTI
jgi:ATP-dependent DNA helicase RecG